MKKFSNIRIEWDSGDCRAHLVRIVWLYTIHRLLSFMSRSRRTNDHKLFSNFHPFWRLNSLEKWTGNKNHPITSSPPVGLSPIFNKSVKKSIFLGTWVKVVISCCSLKIFSICSTTKLIVAVAGRSCCADGKISFHNHPEFDERNEQNVTGLFPNGFSWFLQILLFVKSPLRASAHKQQQRQIVRRMVWSKIVTKYWSRGV